MKGSYSLYLRFNLEKVKKAFKPNYIIMYCFYGDKILVLRKI